MVFVERTRDEENGGRGVGVDIVCNKSSGKDDILPGYREIQPEHTKFRPTTQSIKGLEIKEWWQGLRDKTTRKSSSVLTLIVLFRNNSTNNSFNDL